MAGKAAQSSARERRRAELRRSTRQRKQRRLLLGGAAAVFAIACTALLIWQLTGGVSSTTGQALYHFQTADFHSLAFDPNDANTIYFGHHHGLKVSHDGGRNWQDTTLADVDAMQLALPAGDGSRRYAAGHDVFYVSTDSGQTWRTQPNNLPGLDLHTFAGSLSDPMRLYAAPVGQGPFTSADGGATWVAITLPPGGQNAQPVLAVDALDPLHIYAGVGATLAESRDGGQSWQAQPGPPGALVALAVDPAAPGALYAGTSTGLERRDASGGWQPLSLRSSGAVLAVAVSPSGSQRVAAVDQQGNFYRSDDGGVTWASK